MDTKISIVTDRQNELNEIKKSSFVKTNNQFYLFSTEGPEKTFI